MCCGPWARTLAGILLLGSLAFGQALPRQLDLRLPGHGELLPLLTAGPDVDLDGRRELIIASHTEQGTRVRLLDGRGRERAAFVAAGRTAEILLGPDADRDGVRDVVLIQPAWRSGRGRVVCWSGLGSRRLWSVDGKDRREPLARWAVCVPDVDGDLVRDVILQSGSTRRLVSGRRGRLEGRPVSFRQDEEAGGLAAGQLDADARSEVFVPTRDAQGWAISVREIEARSSTWRQMLPAESGPPSVMPVGDLDLDGHTDLAIGLPGHGRGRGLLRLVSGHGGEVLGEAAGLALDGGFGGKVHHGGDLDGDGAPDLVIFAPREAGGGAAHALSTSGGLTPLATWEAEPGYRVIALATARGLDANGDGIDELAILLEDPSKERPARLQLVSVAGVCRYGLETSLQLSWVPAPGLPANVGHVRLSGGKPQGTVLLAVSLGSAMLRGPGIVGDILIDPSPGSVLYNPVILDEDGSFTFWFVSLKLPPHAGQIVYGQALQLGEDLVLSNALQALFSR